VTLIGVAALMLSAQTSQGSALERRVLEDEIEEREDGGKVFTGVDGTKILIMPDGSVVDYFDEEKTVEGDKVETKDNGEE